MLELLPSNPHRRLQEALDEHALSGERCSRSEEQLYGKLNLP
jgi:hypothetical protein